MSVEEDLRRAVWPVQVDDMGQPMSAAFYTKDMSVDVASLAFVETTRERFPKSYTAIVRCKVFIEVGHPHPPEHEPTDDNPAHAKVPGRLSKGRARGIARAVRYLYPPLPPTS